MAKRYRFTAPEPEVAPNYERVARALSDADLEDEILLGRGEPGYKSALVDEADRRARAGAPT